MRPATSVLRSRQPLMLTLPPGGVAPALPPLAPAAAPHAAPVLLAGKPPSLGPDCPYWKSNSRPSTALTRPTANSISGRNRVRAYHSLSLLRVRLPSNVLRPADVIWSKSPVIVTFGAGA